MKYLICYLLVLSVVTVRGQKLLWATEVVEVSSSLKDELALDNLGRTPFSAEQALGVPDIFPRGGIFSRAWMPATTGSKEFIRVRFAEAIPVRKIILFETNHPGALAEIIAYDSARVSHQWLSLTPQAVDLSSRMLQIINHGENYKVTELELHFDGSVLQGRYAVDAIGISDDPNLNFDILSIRSNHALVDVKALNRHVNSSYNEFNPILSPDHHQLYFSRGRHPDNIGKGKYEDIWISQLDSSTQDWAEATRIPGPVNNEGPNFISSVYAFRDTLFFVLGNAYKKRGMRAGVSTICKVGEHWLTPQNLEIENFYNSSREGSFFLSKDKKYLLMAIDRIDSYGSNDIYVAFRQDDGSYSKPMNLGRNINTKGKETTPFLSSDTRKVYFASDGHQGKGGLDIYSSERIGATWDQWTEPKSIATINSEVDEFGLSIDKDRLYFVRGTVKGTDIYEVDSMKIEPVESIYITGLVIDENGHPISTSIQLLDRQNRFLDQIASENDGNFKIETEKDKVLKLNVDNEHLQSNSTVVIDGKNHQLDTIPMTITVFHKNKKELNHRGEIYDTLISKEVILFDFNSAHVDSTQHDKLTSFISASSPSQTIVLNGFADSKGSKTYNNTLSLKRAQAVRYILIKNGVPPEKIKVNAFGMRNPVAPNTLKGKDNPEGRRLNRRVEIYLTLERK
jgi:outer membrane protein OmpA-like peptidoglycan-associated protein